MELYAYLAGRRANKEAEGRSGFSRHWRGVENKVVVRSILVVLAEVKC